MLDKLEEDHSMAALKLMVAIEQALVMLQRGRVEQATALLIKKLEEVRRA